MIKGLSDRRRLPRLGKIHTGIKAMNDQGIEYPKAVDYFVCPPDLQKIFGDKPKELHIMFPTEDPNQWASQFYRCYSATRGLICKGDGVAATMLVDTKTGALATRNSKQTEMRDIECPGRECPYYEKQCREMMMLQFLIPEAPGLGVYQLDTSSINSMININSALDLVKGVVGRVSMVPLNLVLEPQEVTPEGKKKIVHVLTLKIQARLIDFMQQKPVPVPVAELPSPDDKTPEMVIPEIQEPKKVSRFSKPIHVDSEQTFPMRNLGDLYTACHKLWSMKPEDVLRELGITDAIQVSDMVTAFMRIKSIKDGKTLTTE